MNGIDAIKYPKYNRPRKVRAYNCLTRNYNFLSQLPFPVRIFDIGCGVGETSKLLPLFNHVVHVLAIDKVAGMVAVADCFNDDLRIRYELADIEDAFSLPKSIQDSFDLVTAFHSLHKIKDYNSAIGNIGNSLKKDGYLLCTLPAKPCQRDLDLEEFFHQSKKWRHCREKNYNRQFKWLTDSDPTTWFRDLLTRSGFEIEHCHVIQEEIAVSDCEALEYMKLSQLSHVDVDEREYAELADQAYQAYSKSSRRLTNGYVSWSFDTVEIIAKKI